MPDTPEARLRERWARAGGASDETVVVTVTGEIDILTAPDLMRELTAACVRAGGTVLVDLSGVGFLGAAGVHVLVDAHRLCERCGVRFGLLNPSPRALRPLVALGLDEVMAVFTAEVSTIRGA